MNGYSSIEERVHIEGRSASHTSTQDGPSRVARFQQTPDPTPWFDPLQTVGIQQATISTEQQFTIPPDTVSTNGSPTMPPSVSDPSPSRHGLSSASIAGLAMIPVGVILVALAIFMYFWLRKRRTCNPAVRHLGPSAPAVPEKDIRSHSSSFDSTVGGEKVRSINAMNTSVVHTEWHASPRPQAQNMATVQHNPWIDQLPKISADITTAGYGARRAMEEGSDSPIDRSSPFRLKRGNTTKKRSSLDPDLMSAWPAPPKPVQTAAVQPLRMGKSYMERRSISAEYFAQERSDRSARGAQEYWEEIRLELGPEPGPTMKL